MKRTNFLQAIGAVSLLPLSACQYRRTDEIKVTPSSPEEQLKFNLWIT